MKVYRGNMNFISKEIRFVGKMVQAWRLDTRNEIQNYKIKLTEKEILKGGRLLVLREQEANTL